MVAWAPSESSSPASVSPPNVLHGTARDIGLGGVFFETSAPIAPGVRGSLARKGSRDLVAVRVSWQKRAGAEGPGGLGLEFESNHRR